MCFETAFFCTAKFVFNKFFHSSRPFPGIWHGDSIVCGCISASTWHEFLLINHNLSVHLILLLNIFWVEARSGDFRSRWAFGDKFLTPSHIVRARIRPIDLLRFPIATSFGRWKFSCQNAGLNVVFITFILAGTWRHMANSLRLRQIVWLVSFSYYTEDWSAIFSLILLWIIVLWWRYIFRLLYGLICECLSIGGIAEISSTDRPRNFLLVSACARYTIRLTCHIFYISLNLVFGEGVSDVAFVGGLLFGHPGRWQSYLSLTGRLHHHTRLCFPLTRTVIIIVLGKTVIFSGPTEQSVRINYERRLCLMSNWISHFIASHAHFA